MATRQEIEWFGQAVHAVLQPTKFADFVDPDAQTMRQQGALKVARLERMGDWDDEDIRNRHTLYEINEGDLHGFVSPSQHVDSFFNNEEESAEGKEQSDLTGEVRPYVVKLWGATVTMTETLWWTRPTTSHYTSLSTQMVAYPQKVTQCAYKCT